LSYHINQYDLINVLDEEDINTIKSNVAIEEENQKQNHRGYPCQIKS
jgi:hypothetical protein